LKAKSAARSDGGQGVTAEITARRSNVRKKKEKDEEAMCLCFVFLCCVECNAIDLHGCRVLFVRYVFNNASSID